MKPQPHPKSHETSAAPSELERLREEARQAKEQYLRTLAEADNAKKRLQREKDEFARFAAETVLRGLLPIVDSLDQALVAVDRQAELPAPQSEAARQAGAEAVIKGVHLIYRQLLGLLDKEGVRRIPTVGERFDPHLHEAVAQVQAADGTPDGTIVEEIQVGYTMHGKVIRPAMVKVAKRAETSDTQHATSEKQRNTESR
jgi:molecular chaperone GrpE